MQVRSHISTLWLIALIFGSIAVVKDTSAMTGLQEPDVTIRAVNGDSALVSPGEIYTVVLNILNNERREQHLIPTLTLPEGWRLANLLSDFSLMGHESDVIFAMFRIPSSAHANLYTLQFDLAAASDSDFVIASATLFLTVKKVFDIELSLEQPDRYLPAGTELDMQLTVTNRGNTPATFEIEARGSHDSSIRLEESRVELEPMESRTLEATMPTDDRLAHQVSQQVHFRASIKQHPSSFTSAEATVHVIPLYSRLKPKAPPIPVLLSLQTVGDEVGNSTQLGVSGHVDALGGSISLDLNLARKSHMPMFGTRDNYSLTYRSEAVDIKLGDHVHRVSPLTTNGQYGMGVSAGFRSGKFEYVGSYQQTRHIFPSQTFLSGTLQYNASSSSAYSVNILRREGLYDGTIVTTRAELSPFGSDHQIDVECGVDSNTAFSTPSCRLNISGSSSQVEYQGRLIRTSESYPGASSNLIQRSGALSYRLRSGIRIDGNILFQKRGFDRYYGRRNFQYRFGGAISKRIGTVSTFADLHFLRQEISHESVGFEVKRTERVVRLRTGFRVRGFGMNGSLDTGTAESVTNAYHGSVFRSRLTARLSPVNDVTLTLSGDYATGYLVNTPNPMSRWLLSGQLLLRLAGRTHFTTTVYRNITESVISQSYTSFQSSLRHSFRSGHRLEIQAQHSKLDGIRSTGSTDYRLVYSLPVGIPDWREDKSRNFVAGRIFDGETNAPISGALLFLGSDMTISDENGLFKLPLQTGETQYLRVDQKSIGFDRIPLLDMPFRIDSDYEIPEVLEIPIVRSSAITGTVSLHGAPDGKQMMGRNSVAMKQISSVRDAIIELRSASGTHRSRSDRSGRFSFLNLPPGRYTIRLLLHSLPGNYTIEPDSMDVLLETGTDYPVEFILKAVIRKIRMLESLDLEQTSVDRPVQRLIAAPTVHKSSPQKALSKGDPGVSENRR